MSQYDTLGLHDFLFHTPEGGLRKMLIDRKNITDIHFNLLIKIVKGCSPEEFAKHFERKDFPRVRMGPAESKIKERFWDDCMVTLLERGLLQPATQIKEAA